jgi:hypothetical protein
VSARPDLGDVHRLLTDERVADSAKVDVVRLLLARTRLPLVFDDFEQNLAPGGGRRSGPGDLPLPGPRRGQLPAPCGGPELRTLAAYVKALGGRLEVVADFGDERLVIG